MNDSKIAYFTGRGEAARAMAARASNDVVRAVHERFAAAYGAYVEQARQAATLTSPAE